MAGMTAKLPVGVVISGSGTNLQALIDATADPSFPARIVTVLSNRPDAQGLERARRAGIPAAVIEHARFATREAFDAALLKALRDAGCRLVCLAGFMRLLGPDFVAAWGETGLINIHPSLLPAFPGLHVHEQALAAGVRITGCTVHFVRPAMDAGPILAQAAVPVCDGDDPQRLAARVLAAEHRLYPLALRLLAEGRVRIAGERVLIEGAGTECTTSLLSPDLP